MDTKEVPSAPSPAATSGTSGSFNSFNIKGDRSLDRKSLFKNFMPKKSSSLDRECAMENATPPHFFSPLSCPPISLARKVGAEFICTFILVFAGTATAIVNQDKQGSEALIGLAASGGLAIMIVILSAGHISGAHVNPAVTISFAALKHFPWKQVPAYIGAQVAGSLCAASMVKVVFHPYMDGGVTVPSGGCVQAFTLEFIISFFLMFVITAVATDTRALGELAGLAVGATVMLNILIAGQTTGASMNPVRTLGPAIAAKNFKAVWVYLIAPVIGALCGAGAYSAIKLPEEDGDGREKPLTV